MGLVTFGFPSEIVNWLKVKFQLNLFVEAGTHRGESARKAASLFERVITIEKNSNFFDISRLELSGINNVTCYHGCTRDHVTAHLSESDRTLFWLDAHWSGEGTSGEDDECPILDELRQIISKNLDVFAILIDDARLFLSPPPVPHNRSFWPRIDQLVRAIPSNCAIFIFNDVIYVLPDTVSEIFAEFLQRYVTEISASDERRPKIKLRRLFPMLMRDDD